MSTTQTINTATIPEEMRRLPHWVVWKREKTESGKWTKVPYRADGKGRASSTDPATWSTYEAAQAVASRYSGIGFVTTRECGIILFDADHCIVDGEILPWAREILAVMQSYTEVSPSGSGLHGYAFGKLPDRGRKCGDAEIYDSGRFFCVTGNMDPTYNRPFRRLTDEETAVVYRMVVARAPAPASTSTPTPTTSTTAPVNGSRHDHLLKLAGSLAHNGASVQAIASAVQAENLTFPDGPKPVDEVAKIVAYVDGHRGDGAAQHRPGTQAPTETIDITAVRSLVYIPTPHNRPPETAPLAELAGVRILSPGGISMITAPAGAGKSAVCESALSTIIVAMGDDLGLRLNAASALDIDTERSQREVHLSRDRFLRRCGLTPTDETPSQVQLVSLRGVPSVAEKVAYLFDVLSAETVPPVVLLDGIGDLVLDPNDTPECVSLVARLCAITHERGIGILCTLHNNPSVSSTKARGVLGSELWRKCESVLIIEKLPDGVRRLTTDYNLGKNRGGSDTVSSCFRWDDAQGMHVSCNAPPPGLKRGTVAVERDSVFEKLSERSSWSHKDAVSAVMVLTGKGERTSRERLAELVSIGRVTKAENGTYSIVENAPDKEAWYQQ